MGSLSSKSRSEKEIIADFKRFDIDGNKSIDLSELTEIFQQLDPSWSKGQIKLLFNAVDANRNGSISVEEFVAWVSREDDDPQNFKGAAQEWRSKQADLEQYPGILHTDIIRLVYEAGIWANLQLTDESAAKRKKSKLEQLQRQIESQRLLSPGAITQLRDMSLACGLMVVSELRAKGQGQADAEKWLAKSIDPKPHTVTPKLWRSTYDLCWAAARYTCFLHLRDTAGQKKETEAFAAAARVCFDPDFSAVYAKKRFIDFQTQDRDLL